MDILAARKKAAKLARAREKSRQEEAGAGQPAPAAQASPPEKADTSAPVPPAPAADTAGHELPAAIEPAEAAAASPDASDNQPQVQEIEMLSFRLGEEEYALLVDDVKEVLKNRELTPVPNAPDYIPGVTALRGPILPVIDLCKRLGIRPGVRDEKSRILVVTLDEEDVGAIVDRVTGVIRIHPDTIRPVPETIQHGAEYLQGIARKNDKLYILLDREKAFGA